MSLLREQLSIQEHPDSEKILKELEAEDSKLQDRLREVGESQKSVLKGLGVPPPARKIEKDLTTADFLSEMKAGVERIIEFATAQRKAVAHNTVAAGVLK